MFSAKNFSMSLDVNFNESLTNDVVSFEQMALVYGRNLLMELKLQAIQPKNVASQNQAAARYAGWVSLCWWHG